jgi:hypothetical protein
MLLLLVPIVLPILVTLLFKKTGFRFTILSYIFTGVAVYHSPWVYFWIEYRHNPPDPAGECLMFEMSIFYLNTFFLLPLSIAIQFLSNQILLKPLRT